ncbi:hypothetical protein A2230_07230 [candidate division WOR-1 bacterium RIFOXYA2_FULL_36_21]|uniref:Transporter n=1 Tax=candidate division WOR-1 bacterium RIFOXYB2_FULL_36_35 TaxID=1802578 RepID=A0A1F4RX53_UNCSA|nr:MAG: hypothetical protein A2230_07230 [candidate division WOR-1 bacterium RIFOXYA2_FULL_36_21]OGC12758.1 MAG: hypothetical protein A2290_01060 [candidate division WOR-1 bacterium RIFOXYB2_FULL_36_35]OGC19793.1 MAG: hypothetical protein A2282_00980 [candidate division WOR-1 bacterium RIFOXYA12_FULL_36_13]
MTRVFIILLCMVLFLPLEAFAGFWVDDWSNAAYYETNGENANFRSALFRGETRFGYQPEENFTAMPYVVLYETYGQDANYWNNNLAYGLGVRLLPFNLFKSDSVFLDWIPSTKFYGEILALTFLKDTATATANGVKTDDFRFGIDVWHEWNLQKTDANLFWAEMWANFTYRNTNFYDDLNFDKFQTYVGYFQFKLGRPIFNGLMPYAALYVNKSGSGAEWLNNVFYGIGLRIEPFREKEEIAPIFRKLKMFAEFLNMYWFNESSTRPKTDFRFGIELTQGR